MPECISTVCFCVHVGCTLPQMLPQEDEPLGKSRRNSSMASCLCREVEILFLNLIDDCLSFSLIYFSSVSNAGSCELNTSAGPVKLHQWRPTWSSGMTCLHPWQLIPGIPGLIGAQRLSGLMFFPHGRS